MKIEISDHTSDASINSENSQNSSDIVQRRERPNVLFVSLDGIQSGVPTLTTPTLTPTTRRNIEQTFIELTCDPSEAAPFQAGFVPPLAPFNFADSGDTNSMGSTESESQSSWHTPIMHEENSMATTDTSSATNNGSPSFTNTINSNSLDIGSLTSATATSATTNSTSRRQGGRRPKASNLSPEEEEKRRVRRERNKLAAARCRKRRVDQTNELLGKVAVLEKEKDLLRKQIEDLNASRDDLQMLLESHRSQCRLQGTGAINVLVTTEAGRMSPVDLKPVILEDFAVKSIKDEPLDPIDSLDGPPSPKRIMLSSNPIVPPLPNVSTISATMASATAFLNTPTTTAAPPLPVSLMIKPTNSKPRPSSLNVPLQMTPSQALALGKTVTDINGVAITTPSTGTFNFDSLMDGGTGLTPVSGPLIPTCSSQNKHPLELSDFRLPPPTSEPSKWVSL